MSPALAGRILTSGPPGKAFFFSLFLLQCAAVLSMIIASTPTSPPSTNHLDYYRTFSTGFFTSSPAHHSKLQSTHRNQRDPFETQVHSSVEISRRVSVSLKTKPKPSPESAGPTDHLPGSFLLHASFSALQLLHPLAVSGTCQAHICLRAFTHVSPYAQNILCLHSRLFVSLHFSAMSPLWGGLPYLCPLSCLFLSHSRHHHLTFSSVQSLSHVRLFATPWTAARQASLSITKYWSFYIYFSSAQQILVHRAVCIHIKLQALGGQRLCVLFAPRSPALKTVSLAL